MNERGDKQNKRAAAGKENAINLDDAKSAFIKSAEKIAEEQETPIGIRPVKLGELKSSVLEAARSAFLLTGHAKEHVSIDSAARWVARVFLNLHRISCICEFPLLEAVGRSNEWIQGNHNKKPRLQEVKDAAGRTKALPEIESTKAAVLAKEFAEQKRKDVLDETFFDFLEANHVRFKGLVENRGWEDHTNIRDLSLALLRETGELCSAVSIKRNDQVIDENIFGSIIEKTSDMFIYTLLLGKETLGTRFEVTKQELFEPSY
jgi:hypothetical protein